MFSIMLRRTPDTQLVRSFFIPIREKITHNQYINLERSNRYAASSTKKRHHAALCTEMMLQRIQPLEMGQYHIHTVWAIHNKRTDLDNTAWAKKFLFDAMVSSSILPTDSLKCVASLSDDCTLVKEDETGVYVEIFQHIDPISLLKQDVILSEQTRSAPSGREKDTSADSRGKEYDEQSDYHGDDGESVPLLIQ